MIIIFFGKGKSLSYQPGNTLPECAVESFNMVRMPRFLSGGSVPVFRYNLFICFQKIRITDCTLTVNTRKGFPQFFRILPCSFSNMEPCDLTGISVKGQPYPSFLFLFSDKTPYFIKFNGQFAFFRFYDTVIIWNIVCNATKKQKQPCERNIHDTADASQRYAFNQQFFNDIFFKTGNCFFFTVFHKLSAAVFAAVILFSVMNMSVFFDIFGIAFRAVHKKILSLNIVILKFLRKIIIHLYVFVKFKCYNSITCVALPKFVFICFSFCCLSEKQVLKKFF